MDGTLGSQTARMLDGSGVEITSREQFEEVHPREARAPAFRSPSTRSAIWPTARRSTPSRRPARPGSRSACASGSSMRNYWPPRTCPASPSSGIAASVQFSHAPSDRDLADRFWGGLEKRAVRVPLPARLGRRASSTARTPRSKSSTRLLGSAPASPRTFDEREAWRPEQALTIEQALNATTVAPAWLARDERRRGKLVPGYLADLVVLDRDPLACEPEGLAEVRVVATMLGGAWTHNPPPS